jgi:para-aminobenzoate synthetase component I
VIGAEPTAILKGSIHQPDGQEQLRAALRNHPPSCGADDMPTGGLCGWVDYEGHYLFGIYPTLLVHRHTDGTWWENGSLSTDLRDPSPTGGSPAPPHPAIGPFHPRTSREAFLDQVGRIRDWIAAGDIYQVNLSQAFDADVHGSSLFDLYRTLRTASPAPMAAWLELDHREVLCSSPESFLHISGRTIETRPIKGTRPRFADPEADRRSARELLGSPKETAELVMITDLLRNDLGQVCEFGSVKVAEMLRLESLAQVHHLVSTVRGILRHDTDAVGALAACFPGGSITGAPKKRAMEIIRELEPSPRGIYCGSIGWLAFNGESRFNIAIRTLVREGSRLTYQTGAGIVADSDPEREYDETLHKAAGIQLALRRFAEAADSLG